MSYYLVRTGEGSKYIDIAKKDGFIAIGWNEVPNIQSLGNIGAIKQSLSKASYEYTPAQINAQTGQIFRFGLEMQVGDIVLSPLGSGEYLVGTVGEYYYLETTNDSCPYRHRRKVTWQAQTLLKDDMSMNLSYALGATLTVYSLDKYDNELNSLISGQSSTPAEKPERIRDVILEGLHSLDGRGFEEFTCHLLEIVGYTSEATQYVGDKGIDVNGVLDAEGLANITLRIQVKRVRNAIGNKEVLSLRGALSQGEHGCLITTSSFTAPAINEAEASGKIQIKLIDGTDLSGLVLKHFDDVDEKYKKLFEIRRKRDFNIEDQFEPLSDSDKIETGRTELEGDAKSEWDTLVCAAKEEGFQAAFMKQKAWWAVRLNQKSIPHIRYIALYQVAPVSKITYYGEVDRIEPYESTGKYKLYLKGDPIKLERPVGLGKNPHLKPQGPKYAELENILNANTLDDVFR